MLTTKSVNIEPALSTISNGWKVKEMEFFLEPMKIYNGWKDGYQCKTLISP